MNSELQKAADQFARVLEEDAVVSGFREAKTTMEQDKDLKTLRDQHAQASFQFRRKQSDASFTQEGISKLRTLFERVSKHPLNVRFADSREEILRLLRDCNKEMSSLLGFDFAGNAAPASCC